MKLKHILPLILLLPATGCHSPLSSDEQQSQYRTVKDTVFASRADSLEWMLTAGTEEEKRSALGNLSLYYSRINKTLSTQYAGELLHLALQAKDKKHESDAYHCMALVHFNNVQHDSAQYYWHKALAIYEELKDESKIYSTKLNMAKSLASSFQMDEALKLMQECLDHCAMNSMHFEKGQVIQSMGELYGDMRMLDLAIDYYQQALTLFESLESNPQIELRRGLCYTNLGEFFYQKLEYEKAIAYRTESLEIFRSIGEVRFISAALKGRSAAFVAVSRFEEAESDLNELIEIAEKTDNNMIRSDALMAKCFFLYAGKDYQQALDYALQAYAITDSTAIRTMNIIRYHLAILSAHAETPERTVAYIDEYVDSSIDAFRDEWTQNLTEMEVKYETEKKELEIAKQKEVIARQNMLRGMLVGGIAVCAIILALLWYLLRLRSRRNLALTERNAALTERTAALTERTAALTERTAALDERNAALSEMNATKDKFFSIISHDMRNPVVAQRDALQMLVQNSSSWDADTLTAYYRELLKSADGQVELIYNLLGWAQLQTGRITYNPATFNLAHRLRSDINLIRNMAEKKGVAFTVSIPDNADITGDAAMLSIIVRNLLTNAVKFTAASPDPSRSGETGTVTLDVTPVYGDNPINITGYTVTVSDTGIGMNAEQIDKLFRLDGARSRKGTAGEQGSGLGLIVCRELLEKHGSELRVESEAGKGSTFSFQLKVI